MNFGKYIHPCSHNSHEGIDYVHCYCLNYVPQNSYIEILPPKMMILGCGTCGLGLCIKGTSALLNKAPRSWLVPSTMRGHREKLHSMKKWALTRH